MFRIIMIILFPFCSFAQIGLDEIESWEHFRQIVRDNNVRSIDELLEVVPSDFKKGYSLLYETKALHRNLVSPRRPRVLMFGWEGKFMMTYNSHPEGRRAKPGEAEVLETIYFGPEGAELREIVFDGVTDPFSRPIPVNPSSCTNCHGQDPKGLWDPYNLWPGAFGSLSRGGMDFIKLGSIEHSYFREFLEEKKSNPRYQFLQGTYKNLSEWNREAELIRPFDPKTMQDALVISDGHSSLPNQRLSMVIGEENLKRLGRKILKTPTEKLEKYKYLIHALAKDENYKEDPREKSYQCAKMMDQFLPPISQNLLPSFREFAKHFSNTALQDYGRVKAQTLVFNQGLSIPGGTFSNSDPFDLEVEARVLRYDPQSIPQLFSKDHGVNGAMAVVYLLKLLGEDEHELNININSGRFNLYNGNIAKCDLPSNGRDPFVTECFDEPVERFFSLYVMPKFPFKLPPEMSCHQLAALSRTALAN